MDNFELLNNERSNNGYIRKSLRQYKNYCNTKARALKKEGSQEYYLYALESNLSKFLLFGSISFLKKNLKMLRERNTQFDCLYRKYVQCFIDNKKNELNLDDLISLRHSFAKYYAFLDDVYVLNENKHDFDQYRINHMWKDINLQFETRDVLDSFLSGSFSLKDHRFNTQIAIRVLKFDSDLKNFTSALDSNENFIKVVSKRFHELLRSVEDLYRFLDDNFVVSEFVLSMRESILTLNKFFSALLDYRKGVESINIESFKAPAAFEKYSAYFENLKNNKSVSPKVLKKMLLNAFEKSYVCNDTKRLMPLLPVFYDIAYDYIEYPEPDIDIESSLMDIKIPASEADH
jgi:uncharacterized protein YerC